MAEPRVHLATVNRHTPDACGGHLVSPALTSDPAGVTCGRCRQTAAWRIASGQPARRHHRYVLEIRTPPVEPGDPGGVWRWSSTRPIGAATRALIPEGSVVVRDNAPDPED